VRYNGGMRRTKASVDEGGVRVPFVIDTVKPQRVSGVLEPMPYTYPNSGDSYLRLLKAIDRPAFAVQFGPVNLINSPGKYHNTAEVIKEYVSKLGPHIKSSHLKDARMHSQVTVHIDEVCKGQGTLSDSWL